MLKRLDIKRLALLTVLGLALAILCALHAISMVATKTDPQTASDLFPANGAAHALVAFETFTAAVEDPDDLREAAVAGRPFAIEAIRQAPSNPRAHTVLALAREEAGDRNLIVAAASRLNRRELALQGLVLDAHLARADYPAVTETLDQILRVHPGYDREFFPVLAQVLEQDETVPVLAQLMDGSSPWHERFASHALRGKLALPNLARLRMERPLADAEFDRQLVLELVQAGEVTAAEELFTELGGGTRRAGNGTRRLDWNAEFPPFDWLFVDEGDFRAQASLDGQQLELFVRPGQGGVIAERILSVPGAPFDIAVTYSPQSTVAGDGSSDGVRLQLRCANGTDVFFDEALEPGENRMAIEVTSAGCAQVALMINARAYTGRPRLDATLGKIRVIER